jgi:signal transduction histidine kinase
MERLIDNLVRRCWPSGRAQTDTLIYHQVRLLVVCSLLGVAVAGVFGVVFWVYLDAPLGALGFLAIGGLVGTMPLLFKHTGSARLCGHMLAGVVLLASVYVVLIRGGYPVSALLYLASIPLLTSYLLGRLEAIWWTMLSVAACAGFYLRAATGHAEWRLIHPTPGEEMLFDAMGVVGGLVVTMVLAVTYERYRRTADERRREALERLAQAQRLESIGKLAGGVAHDFNNIVTVIKGTADMMLSELPEGDELARDVSEIRVAAQRAADLTHQLLVFSRHREAESVSLDLADCLDQLLPLLKRTLREDIQLEVDVVSGMNQVLLDRSQFEQVLLTLVSNAKDAMLSGGKLSISLKQLEVVELAKNGLPADLARGSYALLRVADSGLGMDEQQLGRIFEPFFTTKGVGFGTGLGLATVHGIVERFGGCIWVESSPGSGSAFHVAFPLNGLAASTESEPAAGAQGDRQRGEKVLLVEDDPSLRQAVGKTLSRAGYQIIEAQDGRQALILLERLEGRLDLLLTDVVMPQMPGTELAARVCNMIPGVRVVFMSGYANPGLRAEIEDGQFVLIEKPFTMRELLDKIEEVLAAK